MKDVAPSPWPDQEAVMSPRKVTASLGFVVAGGRTILGPQYTPHPFHITRPFHLEGDPAGMATLYLQSSSGGLYGDDDLTLNVAADAGSAVHLTTQAASVVNPARGGQTRQTVRIDLGAGALVEYLPDPVILFDGADLSARVEIRLGTGAVLILGDSALTHDPTGRGNPFISFRNTIKIADTSGVPLMTERMLVSGADWMIRTCGLPAHGVLVVAGAVDCGSVVSAVNAAFDEAKDSDRIYAACAAFPERGLVIARFLCADGMTLNQTRDRVWSAIRLAMIGRAPPIRRK